MYHSKLLKIFSVLSPEDLRQLQKMLKSPFFTRNENLQKLFKLLRDKHPELKSAQLKKETAFAKIFPKLKYSDIKLRNLMSELRDIIEHLFILQQLKNDQATQNKFLTNALIKKGNQDLMARQEKQLKKYIDGEKFHTVEFYYSKFENIQLRRKIVQSRDHSLSAELIREADETLDSFYLFAKTKLALELKNLSRFAAVQQTQDDKNPLQENIVFQIYNDFNTLLDNNEIDLFFHIKDRYFENLNVIDKETQFDIFSLLINYTVQKMEVDDEKFNTIAFEIYQSGIESQVLTQSPLLLEGHFFNIATAGSKEKQFDWTFNFIHSHEHFLNSANKDDLIKSSLSSLYFHKQEFQKAIDVVIQHQFSNHSLNYVTKSNLIRCYYELFLQNDSYHELFIAQTYSYEKFLQRSSNLSPSRKKALLNFNRFVRKLANTRTKGKLTNDERTRMHNLLIEQKVTISRSWLIQKIDH